MTEKIIIFPSGYHARMTYRALKRVSGIEVIAFADNDPELQNTNCLGIPIIAPHEIKNLSFDRIAVAGRCRTAINEQITNELAISEKLIWNVKKSEMKASKEELERKEKLLLELLQELILFLKAEKIKFWAMYSALLGLVRGDNLASFADLDFCIQSDNYTALEKKIRKHFKPFKDITILSTIKGSSGRLDFIKYPKNPEDEYTSIDLFAIEQKDGQIKWEGCSVPSIAIDETELNPLKEVNYKNIIIPIPKRSKAIIEMLYGKDWKKPAELWDGKFISTSLS